MSPASRHAVLAAFALFACMWRTYTVQQREAALALTYDAETRGPVPIPPSERSLQTVVGGGHINGAFFKPAWSTKSASCSCQVLMDVTRFPRLLTVSWITTVPCLSN
jgi:hypothetical protein